MYFVQKKNTTTKGEYFKCKIRLGPKSDRSGFVFKSLIGTMIIDEIDIISLSFVCV